MIALLTIVIVYFRFISKYALHVLYYRAYLYAYYLLVCFTQLSSVLLTVWPVTAATRVEQTAVKPDSTYTT